MKSWRDLTAEEKGALLLASHEGKTLQYWKRGTGGWEDCLPVVIHKHEFYRVKPEPKKPREFWLVNLEAFTYEWEAKQAQDVRGGVIIHVVEKVE